jgi:Cellulose biosynthesis protein BcsS
MARTHVSCSIALCVGLLWPGAVAAGDVFTGYQVDNHGEYFSYLGVRTPITSGESNLQPFIQVLGGGYGYTFIDNGAKRDAEVQFVTPSLGLKYIQGPWNFIGFAGPQFRWKQEDNAAGGKTNENDVGLYLQGEAFYWHEKGIFHAIVSYTDLDKFVWSRLRATRLVHKSEQGCCFTYLGWDIAGMGNVDFYAVQTGPLVQVPVKRFYLTFRGGYQYSQTFHSGAYGGVELYFPF